MDNHVAFAAKAAATVPTIGVRFSSPKAAVPRSRMACQLGSVGDVRGRRGELSRLMRRTGCAHASG